MAKINVVKKIAEGTKPSIEENAEIQAWNVVAQRLGAAPLDTTEIFTDKLSADAYAKGTLTSKYQYGAKSYVGQHVTVVNELSGSADMYVIQNVSGDLRKVTMSPLSGQTFDFANYTLGDIVKQMISALGGTVIGDTAG